MSIFATQVNNLISIHDNTGSTTLTITQHGDIVTTIPDDNFKAGRVRATDCSYAKNGEYVHLWDILEHMSNVSQRGRFMVVEPTILSKIIDIVQSYDGPIEYAGLTLAEIVNKMYLHAENI